MIYKNGKTTQSVWYQEKQISVVYYYAKIVWQAIRSCFGAGFWRGDKPWIGSDAWKG